jgi:hypothetical protein
MYGKDNIESKKNKLTVYRVNLLKNDEVINIKTVVKVRNLGNWRVKFFRLATPMEIKLLKVSEIFS